MRGDRLYRIISAPVITEKATLLSEHNQVSFRVSLDASKPDIKAASSKYQGQGYGRQHADDQGQDETVPGRPGKRADIKKAIVTLAEGQSIDVTTGI